MAPQDALSEFDLIKQYFVRQRPGRATLGIGDDCALLTPTTGRQIAISSDMLVEDRHFFAGADARMLGHKSLAVNLSDLAAMGARPVAFTLALSLPQADRHWLAGFAEGLFALADEHGCELIGGDTTKGPLNICITVFGELAPGQALRRSAARAGDDIWISGTLGDARLALAGYRMEQNLPPADLLTAAARMHTPTPRVALGCALAEAGIVHAAIDISDGLVGDLGHILKASQVGATLDVDALPAGPVLARQDKALRRRYTAAGGDDYELCFTAPAASRDAIAALAISCGTTVTRVGRIDTEAGLRLVDAAGLPLDLQLASFDHFSG
ncbi:MULTISPECIES: thiamine-phosphate kinase [unclassified Janthinobacterium]|uniref:thiamine-phosphate kinase n=1 Tax=unclassified Janthinobacterium TaxID=2610881 RepID=UPI00160AE3A9|nr:MULTISPECIES: thiamine-phosphate kinase [unclassified Janthinobacterium]MBB5368109.1 thiamine-monophosphate kinase [Janthinobacterium sp. K2C7]MBB5379413.1 thiamine-monophosphate kinase [Janthinobacterium sp. K2Li3]MBB5386491.1 thiamine-monophosphate kinase [Janthinobacterium sp. K2E3]